MSRSMSIKKIKSIYDQQAYAYANQAKDFYSWKYIEKPALDRIFKGVNLKGKRILDAACGNGRIIEYLIGKGVGVENILGLDLSSNMIKIAQNKFDGIRFILGDIATFKPENQKLDIIICILALRYLNNLDLSKALNNFYKMLNKDGILLFIDGHPLRSSLDNNNKYFECGWATEATPWGKTNPFFYRPLDEYINQTIKAGFQIEVLDEMKVISAGKVDPEKYNRRQSIPSRFAVLAVKD